MRLKKKKRIFVWTLAQHAYAPSTREKKKGREGLKAQRVAFFFFFAVQPSNRKLVRRLYHYRYLLPLDLRSVFQVLRKVGSCPNVGAKFISPLSLINWFRFNFTFFFILINNNRKVKTTTKKKKKKERENARGGQQTCRASFASIGCTTAPKRAF